MASSLRTRSFRSASSIRPPAGVTLGAQMDADKMTPLRAEPWPSAMVVTHDRAFLDRFATRIVELDRGLMRAYPGNYTDFERRKEGDDRRLVIRCRPRIDPVANDLGFPRLRYGPLQRVHRLPIVVRVQHDSSRCARNAKLTEDCGRSARR